MLPARRSLPGRRSGAQDERGPTPPGAGFDCPGIPLVREENDQPQAAEQKAKIAQLNDEVNQLETAWVKRFSLLEKSFLSLDSLNSESSFESDLDSLSKTLKRLSLSHILSIEDHLFALLDYLQLEFTSLYGSISGIPCFFYIFNMF